jgi:hypothetical protein
MRCLPAAVFAAIILAAGLSLADPGITSRNDFETEAEAARHCRGAPVVWVVPRDHSYFLAGDPGYGIVAGGAYMCENEAKGDRNRRSSSAPRLPQ